MDEQQQTGLNVETASAEAGTPEAGDGFEAMFLQAFQGESAEPLAMGSDGGAEPGTDEGETPQAPATGETETAEESNPPAGDEPEGAEAAQSQPSPRILRYRDNHEERTFDVTAATDAELIDMRQKANMFDRLKAAQAEHADAEKFRSAVQSKMKQFIEDYGVEGAKSLAVAGAMADGLKVYPISVSEDGGVSLTKNYLDIPDIPAPEANQTAEPTPKPPSAPDLNAELQELRAAFPNLTQIPQEVEALHQKGVPYWGAMLLHNMNAAQSKAAATAKENRTLRQNAEAARRAPVTGVSGGGTPPKQRTADNDEFLREFLKP